MAELKPLTKNTDLPMRSPKQSWNYLGWGASTHIH